MGLGCGVGRRGAPDGRGGAVVCARVRVSVRQGPAAPRPGGPGELVGQKVLWPKTMVEREIQLVQGLVPISQPLNAKGVKRMGGWGRAFLLHFPFHSGGLSRPFSLPAGLNLHRALKESFGLYICHMRLRRFGQRRGRGG